MKLGKLHCQITDVCTHKTLIYHISTITIRPSQHYNLLEP